MKNSNIDFPYYFEENKKFKSLDVETTSFVKYTHNNAEIQNILLKIHQPFLLFVRKGQVIFSTKNKTRVVSSKELILVNKGHYIMSENLSEKKEFDALLFFVNPYFIKVLEEKNSEIVKIFKSNLDLLSLKVNNYVESYIQTFLSLFDDENSLLKSENYLKLKANEFLFYLEQNMFIDVESKLKKPETIENERLKKVIENKWEKHSIKQLAFLVCMSESKFKRKFKEVYNETPGKWIREKKLLKAKDRLLNTNDKIYLIAIELGFKDEKYFSKLFKITYGITPNDYRKQIVADNKERIKKTKTKD